MRRRTLADPVFVSGVLLLGVVVPVVTLRHSRQEDNVLVWIARSGFPFVVMAALFISIDRVLSEIARSRGFDSAQDFLKSSDTSVSLKLGAASAYSVAVVVTVVSVFVSIPGGM